MRYNNIVTTAQLFLNFATLFRCLFATCRLVKRHNVHLILTNMNPAIIHKLTQVRDQLNMLTQHSTHPPCTRLHQHSNFFDRSRILSLKYFSCYPSKTKELLNKLQKEDFCPHQQI